jgi:hypothetical protein
MSAKNFACITRRVLRRGNVWERKQEPMKTVKGAILSLAIVVTSSIQSFGVVGQAIAVQGTNLVLSWPSQGYEYYMIQYWPNLTMPSVQLTNCYPANSTNLTTFVIQCCTLEALGAGSGTNSGGNVSLDPSAPMMVSGGENMSLSEPTSTPPDPNLLAMPADGSGSVVPFFLYPSGIDTNGLLIFEAPQSDNQSETANLLGADSSDASGAGPAGFSNGGCDCPSYGFFRVWHIPNP